MAQTSKPLVLLVHSTLLETDEVKELEHKGHVILHMTPQQEDCDLILGPNCWRIYPKLYKYINIAVKAARLIRYPKKSTEV